MFKIKKSPWFTWSFFFIIFIFIILVPLCLKVLWLVAIWHHLLMHCCPRHDRHWRLLPKHSRHCHDSTTQGSWIHGRVHPIRWQGGPTRNLLLFCTWHDRVSEATKKKTLDPKRGWAHAQAASNQLIPQMTENENKIVWIEFLPKLQVWWCNTMKQCKESPKESCSFCRNPPRKVAVSAGIPKGKLQFLQESPKESCSFCKSPFCT